MGNFFNFWYCFVEKLKQVNKINRIYAHHLNTTLSSTSSAIAYAMDPWTPTDRDAWINHAINATTMKGFRAPYNFRVYPKLNGTEINDAKRAAMTDALARTIFTKNPAYRQISLKFYDMLLDKIKVSTFVNRHYMTNFVILLKGSTAYRMILGDMEPYSSEFAYSDMDIVICINPYLDNELFNSLRASLNAILLQVISQYKRILDHMLFLNKPTPEWFLDQDTINQFKADLQTEFDAINGFDGQFLSPCQSDEIRNTCSKYSFVLQNSVAQDNSVVRIEVPHYDKCERIPLRKTPLHASHNTSISFNRTAGAETTTKGEFDLYRLKLTGLYMGMEESSNANNSASESDTDADSVCSIVEHTVPMDFIDVSIPNKDDAPLIDFWNNGRCINIYEPNIKNWLVVPDIPTCVSDLYNMLHVYECPESKREKRERRYNIMKAIADKLPTY